MAQSRLLEPDAPLFFVSAGGLKESFFAVAEDLDQPVIAWTIEDLF